MFPFCLSFVDDKWQWIIALCWDTYRVKQWTAFKIEISKMPTWDSGGFWGTNTSLPDATRINVNFLAVETLKHTTAKDFRADTWCCQFKSGTGITPVVIVVVLRFLRETSTWLFYFLRTGRLLFYSFSAFTVNQMNMQNGCQFPLKRVYFWQPGP